MWYYLVMANLSRNEIFKSLRFIGEILSGIKYRKRRFAPANCPGMGFNLLYIPDITSLFKHSYWKCRVHAQ